MPHSRELMARVLSPHRVAAAEAEAREFDRFCGELRVPDGFDAVTLYLTSHLPEGGRRVRSRLARLDLAAHLEGKPPPSQAPEMRRFLRGLHHSAPLGPVLEKAEPLYVGHVRMLVDETQAPTWSQLRDVAFILTLNATGLRDTEVTRLRWNDIRIHRDGIDIDILLRKGRRVPVATSLHLPRSGGATCAPTALARLRAATASLEMPIFATRGEHVTNRRLRGLAATVTASRRGPQQLSKPTLDEGAMAELVRHVCAPPAIGHRDRALLLLGYLAALGNLEASALRVGDITITPKGLLVRIPSRPVSTVAIPQNVERRYCPVSAWEAWLDCIDRAGLGEAGTPAFLPCDPTRPILGLASLSAQGLSDVVARRCGTCQAA